MLKLSKLKPNVFKLCSRLFSSSSVVLPDSVDWSKSGAVTRVKDQGDTPNCWVYAAVGSVESAHQIVTGELLELSEQCIIDCSTSLFPEKREIGLSAAHAFRYIKKNKGLPLEVDYPTTGKFGKCDHYKKKLIAASIYGFQKVPPNEDALKAAVARQPVAVALSTSNAGFMNYELGVFDGYCGKKIDHAALLVGYGTTEQMEDYWILKNSWGLIWGDHGYIRIARNTSEPDGVCRITRRAYIPLVTGLDPINFQ